MSGEELRMLRVSNNISQSVLAKRCGWNQTSISKKEKNILPISEEDEKKIREAVDKGAGPTSLGVNKGSLLGLS